MSLHIHSLNDRLKKLKEKTKNITMTTIITRRTISRDEHEFNGHQKWGGGGGGGYGSITPLSAIADAFEELSGLIKAKGFDYDLRLKPFSDACVLVSVPFKCLGLAFKFAEMEYIAKVHELEEASTTFKTLNNVLNFDVKNGTVKSQGSLSRNLRRVRQGLHLIQALFQNFLSSNDNSLKEAASTAYAKVCAPYHSWTVRTAVSAGMRTLPSREQLLIKLNETDESAEKAMRRYIDASQPVLDYIDKLFISRNITLDW